MSERRRLNKLAIVVCVAVGLGVAVLLAILHGGGILSYGVMVGLLALVYIVTGLAVGLWAGFEGAQHGTRAGALLAVCIVIANLVIMISGGKASERMAPFIIGSLIELVIGTLLGSLGGFLAARIRPAKIEIAPPSVGEDSQEDSQPQHDEDNNQVGLNDSEVQEISRLSDRFRDW